jgi:hypothetical protein
MLQHALTGATAGHKTSCVAVLLLPADITPAGTKRTASDPV